MLSAGPSGEWPINTNHYLSSCAALSSHRATAPAQWWMYPRQELRSLWRTCEKTYLKLLSQTRAGNQHHSTFRSVIRGLWRDIYISLHRSCLGFSQNFGPQPRPHLAGPDPLQRQWRIQSGEVGDVGRLFPETRHHHLPILHLPWCPRGQAVIHEKQEGKIHTMTKIIRVTAKQKSPHNNALRVLHENNSFFY